MLNSRLFRLAAIPFLLAILCGCSSAPTIKHFSELGKPQSIEEFLETVTQKLAPHGFESYADGELLMVNVGTPKNVLPVRDALSDLCFRIKGVNIDSLRYRKKVPKIPPLVSKSKIYSASFGGVILPISTLYDEAFNEVGESVGGNTLITDHEKAPFKGVCVDYSGSQSKEMLKIPFGFKFAGRYTDGSNSSDGIYLVLIRNGYAADFLDRFREAHNAKVN